MDFLLKALGIGLTIAGAKKIKHNIGEEIKRKNTICRFDGGISKEEFHTMVKCGGKGIRRITSLYAEGAMVYGTVRSKSGISDWCFDSNIPKLVASRIAQQIKKYPDSVDGSFKEEFYREEAEQRRRKQATAYCPYCGKQVPDEEAKFCMYCGMRFRI